MNEEHHSNLFTFSRSCSGVENLAFFFFHGQLGSQGSAFQVCGGITICFAAEDGLWESKRRKRVEQAVARSRSGQIWEINSSCQWLDRCKFVRFTFNVSSISILIWCKPEHTFVPFDLLGFVPLAFHKTLMWTTHKAVSCNQLSVASLGNKTSVATHKRCLKITNVSFVTILKTKVEFIVQFTETFFVWSKTGVDNLFVAWCMSAVNRCTCHLNVYFVLSMKHCTLWLTCFHHGDFYHTDGEGTKRTHCWVDQVQTGAGAGPPGECFLYLMKLHQVRELAQEYLWFAIFVFITVGDCNVQWDLQMVTIFKEDELFDQVDSTKKALCPVKESRVHRKQLQLWRADSQNCFLPPVQLERTPSALWQIVLPFCFVFMEEINRVKLGQPHSPDFPRHLFK